MKITKSNWISKEVSYTFRLPKPKIIKTRDFLRTLFMVSPVTGKRLKLCKIKESVNENKFELIFNNKKEMWQHTVTTTEL